MYRESVKEWGESVLYQIIFANLEKLKFLVLAFLFSF